PLRTLSDEQFAHGLEWACDPVERTAALILREDDEDRFRAFDYVVDYADRGEGGARRPVTAEAWAFALAHAAPAELASVGLASYTRGELVVAEEASRLGDEAGDGLAAGRLGFLLQQRGDLEGTEAAYRRGDERGNATAAFNLGNLLRERGDL